MTCIFFLGTNLSILVSAEEKVQEEVIYNVLIDRYNNRNHQIDQQVDVENPLKYHGGDFEGIINKLDDLKELGVTTISLSPIMANADDGYHGYWIEDFYKIEEQFGTMEDFQLLVEEAHNRNMKIIIEFVTKYVAESHPIVNEAEKDWFTDQEQSGPDWLDHTASLNLENEEVKSYMMDVADYWINETDIDGYLLHGVDRVPMEFLTELTEHIQANNPNFYLLGDTLITDENNQEILENTTLQAIENRSIATVMSDVFSMPDNEVSEIYDVWKENESTSSLLYVDDMYTKRFTQKFSENGRNSLTVWKLALTYMFTTPGTPMIFQGSEIPMYGGNAHEAQQLVQFNSGEDELQEYYQKISSLRQHFPALEHGDFELVGSSGAMSVFRRSYEGETVFIAINNSSESKEVSLTDIESGMQLRGYLGDNTVRENQDGVYRLGLARETAEVYTVGPNTGLNWGFISFVGGVFVLFIFAVIYLSRKQKKQEEKV
ncbi:alpha-amlyase [Oceanobacillus halophilus]|uniref:Alpha-amlyase n=2 Tax=Oceanobacillus halophilus TaxID=930130 RepID=A0A494ZXT9_9BACI|nr:alpha-amlyase [Oceanobacillus halophilus]